MQSEQKSVALMKDLVRMFKNMVIFYRMRLSRLLQKMNAYCSANIDTSLGCGKQSSYEKFGEKVCGSIMLVSC